MRRPHFGGMMQSPARSAERLFFGVGIALVLVTAFALIDERLPPDECPEVTPLNEEPCTASSTLGWAFPAGAVATLGLGLMYRRSRIKGTTSPFAKYFPNESESAIAERISEEHSDANDTDRLSGAWADMEVKMLETTHGEEE